MSDFKAKVHQNRFRLGLCPRLIWGTYSAPNTLYWNKKDLLLREGEGAGKGKERKGRERRGKGRLAILMLVCFRRRDPANQTFSAIVRTIVRFWEFFNGRRSCSGRLFHSVGPAVGKQRSLNCLRDLLTKHVRLSADRKRFAMSPYNSVVNFFTNFDYKVPTKFC